MLLSDGKVTLTIRYHCILSPYIAHLRIGLEMWGGGQLLTYFLKVRSAKRTKPYSLGGGSGAENQCRSKN